MIAQDNGGPAFPAGNEANVNSTMGMTLRDWFAGQASDIPTDMPLNYLEALVGRAYAAPFGTLEHWQFVADAEAAWKMLQADAMLAARKRGAK